MRNLGNERLILKGFTNLGGTHNSDSDSRLYLTKQTLSLIPISKSNFLIYEVNTDTTLISSVIFPILYNRQFSSVMGNDNWGALTRPCIISSSIAHHKAYQVAQKKKKLHFKSKNNLTSLSRSNLYVWQINCQIKEISFRMKHYSRKRM